MPISPRALPDLLGLPQARVGKIMRAKRSEREAIVELIANVSPLEIGDRGKVTNGVAALNAVRRLLTICLVVVASATAEAAPKTVQITFVLVNDIYLMGDMLMPDGKRRGGFARLASVVKAERAKGRHVVFAHAGDTISPSLMKMR